jgi:hypothetical protein
VYEHYQTIPVLMQTIISYYKKSLFMDGNL